MCDCWRLFFPCSLPLCGICLAFMTYYWKRVNADRIAEKYKGLHAFLMNKWYFDELYNGVVVEGRSALTNAPAVVRQHHHRRRRERHGRHYARAHRSSAASSTMWSLTAP